MVKALLRESKISKRFLTECNWTHLSVRAEAVAGSFVRAEQRRKHFPAHVTRPLGHAPSRTHICSTGEQT